MIPFVTMLEICSGMLFQSVLGKNALPERAFPVCMPANALALFQSKQCVSFTKIHEIFN